MGRPSKLTPERHEKIVEALKLGNYFETSVRAAGVSDSRAYEWMRRGEPVLDPQSEEFAELEADDQIKHMALQPYRDFRLAVLAAIEEAELRDIAVIDKAAQSGTWQAAAWKRERQRPDRWGRLEGLKLQEAAMKELSAHVLGTVLEILDRHIADPSARKSATEDLLASLSGGGGAPETAGSRT